MDDRDGVIAKDKLLNLIFNKWFNWNQIKKI